MITKQDAERIIKERQTRLDELSRPEVWDRYTRHMECGEEREFKQSCIDDEIIIEALKPYTSDKPKTHFDRIKAMSVETMAVFLARISTDCEKFCVFVDENGDCIGCGGQCAIGIKQWLESEVREDE